MEETSGLQLEGTLNILECRALERWEHDWEIREDQTLWRSLVETKDGGKWVWYTVVSKDLEYDAAHPVEEYVGQVALDSTRRAYRKAHGGAEP